MSNEKTTLSGIPLTNAERQWLADRLEVLSVKEEYQLAAAMLGTEKLSELAGKERPELRAAVPDMKVETAVELINCLLSLPEYGVCYPASSYEALGKYCLRYETDIPATAIPFVDMDRLGQRYEDYHPGLFIGHCFVTYPKEKSSQPYDGNHLNALKDDGWSLRLKLASTEKPEGVWLRLPDYSIANDGKPDETVLALRELRVEKIQACTLLEARCILPEIGDLMQYDKLEDLLYDGNDLGFALDKQRQEMPDFWEKFAAAMEYENCHTLVKALDIVEDLHRYDFVRACDAEAYGRAALEKHGHDRDAMLARCINFEEYGASLLEREGYRLNVTETAYIRRGGQALQHKHTQPPDQGMIIK